MHPLVRDLYKRFLHVGPDYPLGLAYVREKAKAAIMANKDMKDEEDILKAVHKGRWWVNEIIGVVKLKKYRAMRQRYGTASDGVAETAQLEKRLADEMKTKGGAASPPPSTGSSVNGASGSQRPLA